jgi:hypothetical protein
MLTKFPPSRVSRWLVLVGASILLLGAAACGVDATAPAPTATPTPAPTLNAPERTAALKAFRRAFDRLDVGRQHQMQWLPNQYDKSVLTWIVPPTGGRYRIGDCGPTVDPPGTCVRGQVENTTEYPMFGTFASCGYEDGSTPGLLVVGNVEPGSVGTWEWHHRVLSGGICAGWDGWSNRGPDSGWREQDDVHDPELWAPTWGRPLPGFGGIVVALSRVPGGGVKESV